MGTMMFKWFNVKSGFGVKRPPRLERITTFTPVELRYFLKKKTLNSCLNPH